ncbi:MAG: hypothetical protein IPO67_22745 [Deltaproteobacteria bacterium]|nr:hypothetical protein [Deltaproteobacteria bacterium]
MIRDALRSLGRRALARVEHQPPPEGPADHFSSAPPRPIVPGEALTVVSWNLQFAAGTRHHFFYDGGQAVFVPPDEVRAVLQAQGEALRVMAPDLALLQEVDRGADRTGRLDQLPPLAKAMGATGTASAVIHRALYVPTPSHRPMGRVELHQATCSTRGLTRAGRTALPLMREARWRQVFNLKRAVLWAELPVEGHKHPLWVGNVHLSAFSRGDGTLQAQVQRLCEQLQTFPPEQPWILAGDFNLLPLGDDPARLGKDAAEYTDDPNPLAALTKLAQEAFAAPLAAEARTYIPYGGAADRKIDHVFTGGPVEVLSAEVERRFDALSDHRPLVVRVRVF